MPPKQANKVWGNVTNHGVKKTNKGNSSMPLSHSNPKGRTKGPNHDHHCSITPLLVEKIGSLPGAHLKVRWVQVQRNIGSNRRTSALPGSALEPMNLLVFVDLHTHQISKGIKSILR